MQFAVDSFHHWFPIEFRAPNSDVRLGYMARCCLVTQRSEHEQVKFCKNFPAKKRWMHSSHCGALSAKNHLRSSFSKSINT